MLASADPAKTEGREISVRELLDAAALRIDDFGGGTPAVNSAIHQIIGRTYQQIGQYREATPHFHAALDLRTTAFGRNDLRTQRSLYDLCDNLFVCGQLDEAAPLLAQSIASLRTGDPNDRELLGRQLYTLGRIHKQGARYADAIACLRESAGLLRNCGEGAQGLALALNELGNVLSRESYHAEAVAAFDEALAVQREEFGPRSAHVGGLLGNLAVAVKRQGRIEDAERLYREALDIQRNTHGGDHPATLGTMINLGGILAERGAHEEAESLFREALPVMRRVHGSESYHVGIACGKLADALRMQGELSEAKAFADESLVIFRAAMGDHPYTAMSLTVRGNVQYDLGEFAGAAESFSEALAIYRKTLGEEHAAVADTEALRVKARQAAEEQAAGE
jgi:tetratricopeptide (TPR) repeat protein